MPERWFRWFRVTSRKRRLYELIDRMGALEEEMRDVSAALLELSDPDDDLAAEIRRLIAALDG